MDGVHPDVPSLVAASEHATNRRPALDSRAAEVQSVQDLEHKNTSENGLCGTRVLGNETRLADIWRASETAPGPGYNNEELCRIRWSACE